ncbi:MAG: MoaD/ThiS family protein [Methanobacteriota archaeon]|nr:MAG: MoaD/ThiS family protein [Euryarchaeota archaeon]
MRSFGSMVPPFPGDKGASLLNDSLPIGATLLWNPVFGPIVNVTVRLMGPYKRAAGITDDITVTPEEPNLGGVLQAIAVRFPEAGKKLQPVAGKIEPAVRVVVNDVVQQGVTPAFPLKDGDRVAFVPIVGGGTEPVTRLSMRARRIDNGLFPASRPLRPAPTR